MEKETLNIFDNEGNHIGTAPRDEVHLKGYWHETFHCWFIKQEKETCSLYFQLRSTDKKDYPNLLDITAAGHILSYESFEDGIREVREETGIEVCYDQLIPVGIVPYEVIKKDFIDRELAHLFLYEFTGTLDDFSLQAEEVSGIFKAELRQFEALRANEVEAIELEGFILNEGEKKESHNLQAVKSDFVPHEEAYYQKVLQHIQEIKVNGTSRIERI
ncbi:NUDIX hydrolase [Bacillus salacetis]|uniref:NUDIX hydrolase n=1 Tax=Bacillus salacetis TaxID=2315464 RepID=A0A3A1R0F6_9BACI|nr:NUDIX domain-containing protein [Bacillus salacetis]RIW33321.1 NUDIX hydrolase [Bacillus salacetis]